MVLALVRTASAEPANSEAAGEHFRRGLEHAKARELDAAAAQFEAAYRASPNFVVLYNLGRTYAAMGRAVDAVDAFTSYLTAGGSSVDPQRRAEVEASIALNEKRIGQADLEIEPANFTLEIDGKPVVPAGRTVRLVAGSHALVVRAPGYRTDTQSLTIEPRATSRFRVRLLKEAGMVASNGWLAIACQVPDVAVFVDDSARGTTPLSTPIAVSAESHRVVFRRAGYTPNAFDWSPSSHSALECGIRPAGTLGRDAATLVISASEADAEVSVDGTLHNNPVLPFGKHHIEVRAFGFRPWLSDVEVARGETKRVTATLVPERRYADEHLRSIRRQQVAGYGMLAVGGALAITAGVLVVQSSHAHQDWQLAVDALNGTPSTAPEYPALEQDVLEQSVHVRTLDDWSLASAIAGGALLVSGAVLVFTAEDAKRYQLPAVGVTANAFTVGWEHAF